MTSSPPNKPPAFTDALHREWQLLLTMKLAREIRAAAAVDFVQLGDGRVVVELASDNEKLADVLWMFCRQQAELKQIDRESFEDGLTGVAGDDALEAIKRVIVGFTRAPLRGAVERSMTMMLEAYESAMATVEQWAKEGGTALAMEAAAKAARDALLTFGESPPSSPPS